MRLYPKDTGYLYVVKDENISIENVRLYVEAPGEFTISFNNGPEQEFIEEMSIPGKYHKERYLLITLHQGSKRYDTDSMPLTLMTIVGVPFQKAYPKVIADLLNEITEIKDEMEDVQENIRLLKEVGDII